MAMNKCACGSYAINPTQHGREEGLDLELCDVCYWRKRAELPESIIPEGLTYWDDDPTYSVADWQCEVANEDTRTGYWAWVANQKELRADEEDDEDDEETDECPGS